MKSYTAISAAALALLSAEARMWLGECPNVQWDTNFDHTKFAGNWYEQVRDGVMTMDMDQKCTTTTARARADGFVDVQFRTYVPMMFDYSQSPVMKMDCSAGMGDCEFEIEGREKKEKDGESSWSGNIDQSGIVATDYDNYFVMYVCGTWGGSLMQTFTIFGKEPVISEEKLQEAKDALSAKVPGLDMSPLLMKNGGNPSFWLGLGQCDYEWNLDQIEFKSD